MQDYFESMFTKADHGIIRLDPFGDETFTGPKMIPIASILIQTCTVGWDPDKEV